MYVLLTKSKVIIIFNFSLNRLNPFVKGLVWSFLFTLSLTHHNVWGSIPGYHVLHVWELSASESVRPTQLGQIWNLSVFNSSQLFSRVYRELRPLSCDIARWSIETHFPPHLEMRCSLVILEEVLVLLLRLRLPSLSIIGLKLGILHCVGTFCSELEVMPF